MAQITKIISIGFNFSRFVPPFCAGATPENDRGCSTL